MKTKRTVKKIISLLIAAVMCMGITGIPVMAETYSPLAPKSTWYVDWSKTPPAATMTSTLRTQSVRHGYLSFEADADYSEYIKNAPVVKLNIGQNRYTGDFTLKILGISSEEGMSKDDYVTKATENTYDTSLREKGAVIGSVTGTGKSTVSVDVSEYVRAQTDNKYLFTIVGTGSADVRCNAFSLECDYSDAAKANVAIGAVELAGNTAAENFTLPTTGKYDTAIVWSSSDESVIAIDGETAVVTRPGEEVGDKSVTLTASITVGTETVTKEFAVTVPAVITSDIVKAVPNADSYAQKSNPDVNFNDQKSIYINGSGRQNFIRFNVMDISAAEVGEAVLNLYLREIKKLDKESFGITVYGLSGQDKTSWDESTLTYNTGAELGLLDSSLESYGTGELAASKTIGCDEVGKWVSVDITDYVKSQEDGVYALRIFGDAVQAYFDTRECDTKEYRPYLEIARGDAGAVANDARALEIADTVHDSFTLPVAGENGSQITWTSSNPDVVIDGASVDVSAFEAETVITLTAAVSKGQYERTKDFEVTVIPAAVSGAADLAELTIPGQIYNNLVLPVEGAHGSQIVWTTESPVITIDGASLSVCTITEKTDAVLTATVINGSFRESKEFAVTLLSNMISVTTDGKQISDFKENQDICVEIVQGGQLGEGRQMHIATYGLSGELLHVWWGLGSDARIDINTDASLGSIGVYIWDGSMRPAACEKILKVSE